MKPGIYSGIPMAQYLAMPAVSASIVRKVLEQCPYAAWNESWLNPDYKPVTNHAMDAGSIAHAILLEGSTDGVEVFDPQDFMGPRGGVPKGWTNDAIKQARDLARQAGKIPVLKSDMAEITAMVTASRAFIETLKESEPAIWALFQPDGGESELTMVWQEGAQLCRMRPDRISPDRRLMCDYKTTARSAEPSSWGRTQFAGMGYYLSAAWYRRGVQALCGVQAEYVFLVQETSAPYLCSIVGTDPHAFALGGDKVEVGLGKWSACVAAGRFPAYPNRVCYPELPKWLDAEWEAQAARTEFEELQAGDDLQEKEGLQP